MKVGTVCALGACLLATLSLPQPRAVAADPVVAAAGDIACAPGDTKDPCEDAATASLLSGASAVLALGDDQYETGSLTEFQNAYDHTWGAYNSIAHPVAGNHEWATAGAQGYKSYFGPIADPDSDQNTYYSWDLGNWHFIALDSDCGNLPPAPGTTNGCGSGSPEEVWLKNDLASNQSQCEIAYWHHPKFTSFPGVNSKVKTFWKDLQNDKAELILNGHSHAYERFAAQLPDGTASASGIVEIIAGTGGHSHMVQKTVKANSLVRNNTAFGVLKLTLHAVSYDFEFVDTSGQILDSGSNVACH